MKPITKDWNNNLSIETFKKSLGNMTRMCENWPDTSILNRFSIPGSSYPAHGALLQHKVQLK